MENDLRELLMKIRYDATAIQAKVTDALNALSAMNLPDPSVLVCPHCGVKAKGPATLSEHVYTSHNGPLPEHWARADALAEEVSQP